MSTKIPTKTLTAFRKEARKTLWAQDGGDNKGKQYRLWEDRITELEKTGLTRPQATVAASKEFTCLSRMFRQFDVSFFDPDPTLSPAGTGGDMEAPIATQQHAEKTIQCEQLTKSGVPEYENLDVPKPKPAGVVCESIVQSHLDNLRWAATAAGVFMRTGKSPKTCPNDQAWFFYRMALEDHKAFLDKLHTVEMKAKEESDRNAALKKSGEVNIREIELMLDELKQEVGE